MSLSIENTAKMHQRPDFQVQTHKHCHLHMLYQGKTRLWVGGKSEYSKPRMSKEGTGFLLGCGKGSPCNPEPGQHMRAHTEGDRFIQPRGNRPWPSLPASRVVWEQAPASPQRHSAPPALSQPCVSPLTNRFEVSRQKAVNA